MLDVVLLDKYVFKELVNLEKEMEGELNVVIKNNIIFIKSEDLIKGVYVEVLDYLFM